MSQNLQSVISGGAVHVPVGGTGPVNVSIAIYGPGGAFGYNPHGTAELQYYDPVQGVRVHEIVPIGGGYTATVVSVTTGSLFSTEAWMGEITVRPRDTYDGVMGNPIPFSGWGESTPGWVRLGLGVWGAIDDAVTGVFGVPGFSVQKLGSGVALGGGVQLNTTYPPGYLAGLGIDPNRLGGRYIAEYDYQGDFIGIGSVPHCFPASTPIAISPTETRPISDIRVGDTVLAFDPAADLGRGALVPRKVVRLYRNTTEEWVKLTWAEGGEAKELVTTPGHHFLDRFGHFPMIEEMLENGRATVVLASGELTEVTAGRSDRRMAA